MSHPLLRNLPSVTDLLESVPLRKLVRGLRRSDVVSAVRVVLDEVRREVQNTAAERTWPDVAELVDRIARRMGPVEHPALRPLINATGVLFHTDLEHTPLPETAAVDLNALLRDYAGRLPNDETPQPRHETMAEDLLIELTGAEAALTLHNAAGAVVLALSAVAAGREVIVSRGHLAEIHDLGRLPDLLKLSGATACEVGVVNHTRLEDYRDAVSERTAAMLRIDPSRFAIPGAAEDPTLESLIALGRERRIPVLHDLGFGGLLESASFGLPGQPSVATSLRAGADLVLFSGHRLLGGPACGIVVGRREWIAKMQSHALAPMLTADPLPKAALAATLRCYREPEKARVTVPMLQLVSTSPENLKNRAGRLAPQIEASSAVESVEILSTVARLSDPTTPAGNMPSWALAVRPKGLNASALAEALRAGEPSILASVESGRVLLDLRGVMPRQDRELVEAFQRLGTSDEAPHAEGDAQS